MPTLRALSGPLALALAALVLAPGAAHAQAALFGGFGGVAGFGTECLSPNDDGSSDPVDLRAAFPAGLRFFSGTYSRVYVNTNGNITFNGALPQYTPQAFPVSDQPMIAPYWADVDIRPFEPGCGGYGGGTSSPGNAACQNPVANGVWWHLSPGSFVVTWHRVGYYSCHGDRLMNFQLVVTDASRCGGPGDFDVEFRYNSCDWTTGDASGGSGGFGGTPAQVGFDAGDSMHFFAVPGSLMSDINTRMCSTSNVGTPGVWHFAIRSGVVGTEHGTQTCGTGTCARVVPVCQNGEPLECTPGAPVPELCNGQDDDCNGVIDDGRRSCGMGACRREVPLCFAQVATVCVPGEPTTEVCNGVDDNCNGVVDEGCGDAGVPDARCVGPGCSARIPLEGRAGPLGGCGCRAAGRVQGARGYGFAGAVALGLAWRRRRRARA